MIDVIVVGAGPAGCYVASLLGEKGFDVHVIEEHPVVGEPVDCSGVIGAESFAALGFAESLKLAEIRNLTLVSPSELEVHFSPPNPLAYIVDRSAFDRAVADKTSAAGVTFHLGWTAVQVDVTHNAVEIMARDSSNGHSLSANGHVKLRGSVLILAGGPRFKFQRQLGMGQPGDFLRTAQTEVAFRGAQKTKVLMGSQVAPGSFAWIVPFQKNGGLSARIGVSAKTGAVPYLKKLLQRLHCNGELDSSEVPIRSWVIPISPLKRTFAERVMAVGDAAGQSKPTTGGGIFYALLSAEAAAQAAAAALQRGDFSAAAMGSYETAWRKRLGREIKTGAFFRRLAERLSDQEIDDLFRVVLSDGVLPAVTKKARFDWHWDVISFALRHPALGRIFLKGLFR